MQNAAAANLSDQLAEFFEKNAGIIFHPTPQGLLGRFCRAEISGTKKSLCKWFANMDHHNRLKFIIGLSWIITPHFKNIITAPNGTLVLRHNGPHNTHDVFRFPINAGAMGNILDDTRLGTLIMNPLCAAMAWIEQGKNPANGESGFMASFEPAPVHHLASRTGAERNDTLESAAA